MSARSGEPAILIITPVRNEAANLPRTIEAMVAQTVRPTRWMIVDDGSKDDTLAIARQAAETHTWIECVSRPDRGARVVGGGVIEAFLDGLARFDLDDFDFLCKLDGDLTFGPRCIEAVLEKFAEDDRLGTTSGKCWDRTGDGWTPLRTSDDFSMGAFKFYRVACYREIGGFVQQVMWDGIDCHRCRMKGWKARSFHDEDMRIYEWRPMGTSHKSVFHGRFRWGRGQYFMGTHWLYVLAIAGYRTFERPYGLGGLCILAGFVSAWLRRVPRYEDREFRRHLHRWQLARLRPF